jgi:blocked-early-in-transport protein 1
MKPELMLIGVEHRFGGSSLHQRDPRSALFENYTGGGNDRTRNASSTPSRPGAHGGSYRYSGAANGSAELGAGLGGDRLGYRPATPNSRYVVNDKFGKQSC